VVSLFLLPMREKEEILLRTRAPTNAWKPPPLKLWELHCVVCMYMDSVREGKYRKAG